MGRARGIGAAVRWGGAVLGAWVLAAGLAGCTGPVPPASAVLLRGGQAAYWRGDDAGTVSLMDRFIAAHPDAQEAGEAHYLRGLARVRQGQLPGAGEDFRQALALTRRGDLSGLANVAMAQLADRRGDDEAGEAGYRSALELLPQRSPASAEALYRLGLLLQRQGQWEQADQQFDRLLYLFETSPRAADANRRIRARAWTIQAGRFGQRRQAAQRADELVKAGLPAVVAAIDVDPLLLAVEVGRYNTLGQAEQELSAVRKLCPEAGVAVTRAGP